MLASERRSAFEVLCREAGLVELARTMQQVAVSEQAGGPDRK